MLKKGKIDNKLSIEENIFSSESEGKDKKKSIEIKNKVEIIGYTGTDSTAATLFEWEDIPEDFGGGKILNKMNFYLSNTKDVDEWKKYKITIEEIE